MILSLIVVILLGALFARAAIGTKSVLVGAHCFFLHWIFVAAGWYNLYRFRRVYIGERKLPFKEQRYREFATGTYPGYFHDWTVPVRTSLLDPRLWLAFLIHDWGYWGKPNMDGPEGELHPLWAGNVMGRFFGAPWSEFTRYHSRFLAKRDGAKPSPLCFADKLAIAYEPGWLYLPRVIFTGEIREYMKDSKRNNGIDVTTRREWNARCKTYCREWVNKFKDGAEDTATPDRGYGSDRETIDATGVWK